MPTKEEPDLLGIFTYIKRNCIESLDYINETPADILIRLKDDFNLGETSANTLNRPNLISFIPIEKGSYSHYFNYYSIFAIYLIRLYRWRVANGSPTNTRSNDELSTELDDVDIDISAEASTIPTITRQTYRNPVIPSNIQSILHNLLELFEESNYNPSEETIRVRINYLISRLFY